MRNCSWVAWHVEHLVRRNFEPVASLLVVLVPIRAAWQCRHHWPAHVVQLALVTSVVLLKTYLTVVSVGRQRKSRVSWVRWHWRLLQVLVRCLVIVLLNFVATALNSLIIEWSWSLLRHVEYIRVVSGHLMLMRRSLFLYKLWVLVRVILHCLLLAVILQPLLQICLFNVPIVHEVKVEAFTNKCFSEH